MRLILSLIIVLTTFGCGKTDETKTSEAIDIALSYLSDDKCEDAIDVLLDVGMQTQDAVYLQVLASAYACKAQFDEIRFIDVDLKAIDTTSVATIFRSFAIMTTSPETVTDSVAYSSINEAISVILNSSTTLPSHNSRVSKFGPRKAGDLSLQTLILSLVNFGKFLRYYGNTNALGVKGTGTGTNSCFINYSDPRASLFISGGSTGACSSLTDGHPDLNLTTVAGRRRLCSPIVALNNVIDILENMDLSSSSSLSILEDVASKVSSFKTAATAAGLAPVLSLTSQSACDNFAATPSQLLDLEFFTALTFEGSLQ